MAHSDRRDAGFRFGPILFFRGPQKDRWRLSALFAIDGEAEPEDLRVDGVQLPVPPRHLTRWRDTHLWRFDFAVPRRPDGAAVGYGFPDQPGWRFHVPAEDDRLDLAYVCGTATAVPKSRPWASIAADLDLKPRHLLLWGGDQVDARSLWRDCPTLAKWCQRSAARREREPFSQTMAEEAFGYQFERQSAFWRQPDIAALAARVPSIMMWGAGDALPGLDPVIAPTAPVARGVALAARRIFSLFQLAARPEAPPENAWSPDGLSLGFRLGSLGILAVDPHAEGGAMRELIRLLDRFAGCRQVIVTIDRPPLLRERDMPRLDLEERRRGFDALAAFARDNDCRVTVLSGAAGLRGTPRGDSRLWQLTASSAPDFPTGIAGWFAARRARRLATPRPGLPFEPVRFASGRRYRLNRPSWLGLSTEPDGALAAVWHYDGKTDAFAPP